MLGSKFPLRGSKPVFFDPSQKKDVIRLKKLISENKIVRANDDFRSQLKELFAIQNPALAHSNEFTRRFDAYIRSKRKEYQGKWVYFPWNGLASHILSHEEFYIVRTARNRNLITAEEQKKYYDAHIGIAGLSVGFSVALAIAMTGGGRKMRLADMDVLALSNMNRVPSSVSELGVKKVEMAARRIFEINPYAEIEIMSDGIKKGNIKHFFSGLDIVIDEIDSISAKYLIREQARRKKIPLVMAADNGDGAVVDIERYDLDYKTRYFHGRLGRATYESLASLDRMGTGRTITRHIGHENVTVRMQESLLEMGKTIVSWPQLGGAALINGAAVAYCVRRIINGQELERTRALLSLDEIFVPSYNDEAEVQKRRNAADAFKSIFGL